MRRATARAFRLWARSYPSPWTHLRQLPHRLSHLRRAGLKSAIREPGSGKSGGCAPHLSESEIDTDPDRCYGREGGVEAAPPGGSLRSVRAECCMQSARAVEALSPCLGVLGAT